MCQYSRSKQNSLLIATCTGRFMNPLMSTMLNLALLSIGNDFDVGSHDLALLNTVFFMGSVVFLVPFARIASIHGMKRMFSIGTIVIGTCALLAAFSPSFWFLVAMRFALGVSSAALVVTSLTMIAAVYPLERRGWAIGINTMIIYLGLALGPVVGGFLSDVAGWRALFWIVVPIAAVTMLVLSRFPDEIIPAPGESMDWRGTVLWTLAIFVTMFGVVIITDPMGIPTIAIGLILFVITWYVLKHTDQPVLNIEMFKNKLFRRSCGATFMNYGASYAVSFFLALYLESIGMMTATEAGAVMLIQPLIQASLTPRFGAIYDRIKDQRLLPTLGMAMTCAGLALFLLMDTKFEFWMVVAAMVVIGLSTAIFATPNTAAIMSAAPPSLSGEASGSLSVVREMGIMTSMGISMACIAIIMGSTDNLVPSNYGLFTDVMHIAFCIFIGMCAIGTALSWMRGNSEASEV
jgi:MFS family permease